MIGSRVRTFWNVFGPVVSTFAFVCSFVILLLLHTASDSELEGADIDNYTSISVDGEGALGRWEEFRFGRRFLRSNRGCVAGEDWACAVASAAELFNFFKGSQDTFDTASIPIGSEIERECIQIIANLDGAESWEFFVRKAQLVHAIGHHLKAKGEKPKRQRKGGQQPQTRHNSHAGLAPLAPTAPVRKASGLLFSCAARRERISSHSLLTLSLALAMAMHVFLMCVVVSSHVSKMRLIIRMWVLISFPLFLAQDLHGNEYMCGSSPFCRQMYQSCCEPVQVARSVQLRQLRAVQETVDGI